MLRKELNAARESKILERKSLTKASNGVPSQKAAPNSQLTSHVSQKRPIVEQEPPLVGSELSLNPKEYVPSAPKRPSSPSNLMEALAVMNSTGLSDDKHPKHPYVPRIPRIPRKPSERPMETTLGPRYSPVPTPNQSEEEQRSRATSVRPSNHQKALHKVTSADRMSKMTKPSVTQPMNSNLAKLPLHQQTKSVSSGIAHKQPVPYRVTLNPTVAKSVTYKPTPLSAPKPENSTTTKSKTNPPSKCNGQHKSSINITKSNSSAVRPADLSHKTQEGPPKPLGKIPHSSGIAAQLGASKAAVRDACQPLSSSTSSVKTQQPFKGPTGIAAQLGSKAIPVLEKKQGTQSTIVSHRAHSLPSSSRCRTPSAYPPASSASGTTMEKSSKPITKQDCQASHSELTATSKKAAIHSTFKSRDEKSISSKPRPHSSQRVGLPDHKVKSQSPAQPLRGIAAQQGAPVRGIAAQFGSLPLQRPRARSPDDYSCDEGDDYASDDSFIDDSESMDAKDYSRYVKVIHKTLNFDPKRYANVSRYDDLSSMESNFRQIEKEERISARLGAKEDEEDIAAEAARRERRRQKLAS
ncbi:hypothetical protein SprV_0200909500 [Sparganum proliferum]